MRLELGGRCWFIVLLNRCRRLKLRIDSGVSGHSQKSYCEAWDWRMQKTGMVFYTEEILDDSKHDREEKILIRDHSPVGSAFRQMFM